MDVSVGDRVQILNSAVDVVTGVKADVGKRYVQGSYQWAKVEAIIDDWKTSSKYDLPSKVKKVILSDDRGVTVWQVQPEDIATNVIKSSAPELMKSIRPVVEKTLDDPKVQNDIKNKTLSKEDASSIVNKSINVMRDPTPEGILDLGISIANRGTSTAEAASANPISPYTTGPDAESWEYGISTSYTASGGVPPTAGPTTKLIGDNPFGNKVSTESFNFVPIDSTPNRIGTKMTQMDVEGREIVTAMSNPEKRQVMLNEDIDNIQNDYAFPQQIKASSGLEPARYDYRIDVGDDRYPLMTKLEDKLMEARASLGLPVHGSQDIARSMKYYMYNRFKTPDINMAHVKSFTHVFFTRPDLNLLAYNGEANRQTKEHTESAMIWQRNPDLFKLLTHCNRCKDSNNFNLLLSNQITSFDISDETMSTVEAGKSWSDYEMVYGDKYMGRSAGQFSCNFVDTNDYSVLHLIKLWITYIDNVSRGQWSPSYDLHGDGGVSKIENMSHVYSKTLDYASSCYVFKCGPDGEDILYWSKYYGIFPINTGASSLSWELSNNVGDTPRLNIQFRYAFKRDMSPMSLLEFNSIANVSDSSQATYEYSFNPDIGLSSRPYVGAPFIEMKLVDPVGFPTRNGASRGPQASHSSLRLKFRKMSDSTLTDNVVYRSNLVRGSSINSSEDLVDRMISYGRRAVLA